MTTVALAPEVTALDTLCAELVEISPNFPPALIFKVDDEVPHIRITVTSHYNATLWLAAFDTWSGYGDWYETTCDGHSVILVVTR